MTLAKTIAMIAGFALSCPALAQYKCTIGGKTVYADEPCAVNARHVGALEDQVSTDQQIQRLQQSIKERRARNRIEGQQEAEYQSQQQAAARYAENEQAQAAANERARRLRCASLERQMRGNARSVAFYQDLAMQRSLTQHEQELKRNREAHDRECR